MASYPHNNQLPQCSSQQYSMPYHHARLSTAQVEAVAGLLAGSTATLVVHPLDVIKTRIQGTPQVQHRNSAGPIDSLGILRALLNRQNPIHSLYRGLAPNLLGNAGSWAIFFSCKSIIEQHIFQFHARFATTSTLAQRNLPYAPAYYTLTPLDYFISSGISGALITLSTNPIWVLKTRMLSLDRGQEGAYESIWHGTKQIWKKEGLKGFYRGLSVSLLGNSHGAVQFGVYEPLKRMWQRYISPPSTADRTPEQRERLGVTATVIISGSAKVIAGTVTYPIQVIRSRMQAYKADGKFGQGIKGIIKALWEDHGWRGFYKGVGINVARVLPSTWVTFLVYENARYFLAI
ncbi:unnamed protein product [Blumeria hordei]|uniref:Mitochondrial carrier protein n=1 Tax=Blumeria hordei TaxID=2867405 RepID=A0A383UPC4_BLUHO|nr:unnamed protein product [Blumeria hordei]